MQKSLWTSRGVCNRGSLVS